MATQRERLEFAAVIAREFHNKPAGEVDQFTRSILRLSKTHGDLAVQACNGPQHLVGPSPYDWQREPEQHRVWINGNRAAMDQWQAALELKQERLDKRIKELCNDFKIKVDLGGDPRGATVKLHLPSGRGNTWGGTEAGWGVPQ